MIACHYMYHVKKGARSAVFLRFSGCACQFPIIY
jgi:hypothetical protein